MSDDIINRIMELKHRRKAVILAHNYQPGEVQDIADFTGDSLGLSVEASKTGAETIVFCGVLFMAETAAILSPDKTVLLPDLLAGCPMADMITPSDMVRLRHKYPDAVVVCYVNSPAEVKALSDYCCTSSNAVELVKRLPAERQIIFVPDKYLGSYVIEKTERPMILWEGFCPTHMRISPDDIERARQSYPGAVVMVHPECRPEVRNRSDYVLSTGQMLRLAARSEAEVFIVCTEPGIIHSLRKQNPHKCFVCPNDDILCPNMKKIGLDKILWSLEDMQYKITVADDVRIRAKAALDKMLEVLPER